MKILSDTDCERGILAGLISHGSIAFHNVVDLGLSDNTFTIDSHRVIFKCLDKIFKNHDNIIPDIPSIYSAASELGLRSWFQRDDEVSYLSSFFNFPVEENNIRPFALKIKKLEIGRNINHRLEQAKSDTLNISGDESINDIFGIVERSILDCGSFLSNQDSKVSKLGDGIKDYFDNLKKNPIDQIGISTGFPVYDDAIGGGLRNGTVNVIAARPKCLEENSLVYTPTGPVKIKELKIGDEICHPNGKTAKIINTIDVGLKNKYKVEFKDGDIVYCDEDHIWEVYKKYGKKNNILKTTKEIIREKFKIGNNPHYKWGIDLPNSIYFKTQELPLDPYILGLLIGDGSFRNAINFCTADPELIECFKNLPKGFELKIENDAKICKTYKINGLQNIIRSIGLYKTKAQTKFIPDIYKYNSIENRIAILRGLMDTDGTAKLNTNETARSQYCSVSLKLVKDIKEIVESLGGLCPIHKNIGIYKNKKHISYICEIILPKINPFKLTRKYNRIKSSRPRTTKVERIIKNISLDGQSNMRCIETDSHDGLFLTNNCIITHNCGKSTLALNIATHISKMNVPVLYLDSEMDKEDAWHRTVACLSQINSREIETGKFANFKNNEIKADDAITIIEKLPFYYTQIAGQPLETQISTIKRWLITDVKLKKNGKANQCVLVYDYLKIMNETEMKGQQEYQAIGFLINSLINFSKKYHFPILTFVQTNRDGINKDDSSVVAQSDRILWMCSSMALLKVKTPEEMHLDGYENGNRKLIVNEARFGPGLSDGNYINLNFNKSISKIVEGKTSFEIKNEQKTKNQQIEINKENSNESTDEEIPF